MADFLIRDFHRGKNEASSESICPADGHGFGQNTVYFGQAQLFAVRQPTPRSVAFAFCEKEIVRGRRKQNDRRIIVDYRMEFGRNAGEVCEKALGNIDQSPFRGDVLKRLEKLPITPVRDPALSGRFINGYGLHFIRQRKVLLKLKFRNARFEFYRGRGAAPGSREGR